MLAREEVLPVLRSTGVFKDTLDLGSDLGKFTQDGCAVFKDEGFPWGLEKKQKTNVCTTIHFKRLKLVNANSHTND